MSDYQIPRDSIYYYGEDTTYKPSKRQPFRLFSESKPKKYIYELDAQGLPVKKPGGGSIADELEAQAKSKSVVSIGGREYNMSNDTDVADLKKLQEQELTRQRNSGLGMSDIRGGDGLKPDGSGDRLPRGTDLGNSGPKPTNWAQYEAFLAQKGIELANSKTQATPFSSNNLPEGSEPITSRKLFQQDGVEFDNIYGAKLRQGDMTTPKLKGLGTGQEENYRPGILGVDPQAGASPLPDASDQTRQLEVDQTKNRALPRGARQREKFLQRNPGYGTPKAPEIEKGSGLSARSRAFLDYEGNSLNALRAADAAQGIMRTRMIDGGAIGVKGADGKITEITREGLDAIRSGERDKTEFSQEFLSNYLATPAKPADAQSPSSIEPKPVTKDLSQLKEAYQSPIYPNMLQNYSEDIPDMDLNPKLLSYMRFPSKK